ncbi:MAG: M23 family metallopeptidase [Actinomycetota bacterium]|nr:M23 family metallopeptidase [Actinomycetota bacterium]
MPKTPVPAAVLLVSLVLALATPGHADSLDDKGASNQAGRTAAAAAKLDAAKADDDQLESAVRDLDTSLTAQSSSTDAAQQAASAAQVAVGSAEARLAATEARMSSLRSAASALAVRAYVHPGGDALLGLLGSADLSEASRRETLLNHVASTDRDVVSQLRATREDQEGEQTDLNRLRDQADARRRAAATHLDELKAARDSQARLRGALDERIQEYQSEVDGLARDQATIENLLKARLASSPSDGLATPALPGASSSYGLIWPAEGSVTSPFGFRWGRMHTGIDIGADTGTPIRAAKAGTVVSSGNDGGGYGLLTVVDHGGGLTTLYAHQSQSAVSGGTSVAQGQVIGYVGCSGHCTGPHLHFETRVGGNPENPAGFLR